MVIESNDEDGTSTVLFIDYGTSERVNNSKLKELPENLRQQPPLAIQCSAQQDAVRNMSAEQLAKSVHEVELTFEIKGSSRPYQLNILEFSKG